MVGRTNLAQRQTIPMKSEKSAEVGLMSKTTLSPKSVRIEVAPARPPEARAVPFALDIQSQIGRQLQAVYDEVLHEPVPDRFLKLLQKLDRKKGGV